MGYKLDCPDCGQSLSPKTVRRHSRMGCPGSKRRKNKLIRSAERTSIPDPPGTPTQPRKRQKNNLRAQHKSWPRSPSPSSGEDTRLRHPDFRLDSPGAGPSSQFPSSLLCSPIDTGDPLTTLYKEQPWLKGLSAEDIVRMRTQEEIAREGGFKLSPEDLLVAEALNYKVTVDATGYAYEAIPHAFPGRLNGFPDESEYTLLVAQLTGMKGVHIDCCINSCVAYTGPYLSRLECPCCGAFRYARDNRSHNGVQAPVRGKPLDHRYFSSPTDIALGLSADGVGPFKTRKRTCWPLVVFNYNLDPAIRHRLENLLCLGVIPGPNEPTELDTFLEPLVDELEQLASGVAAFDGAQMHPFCLRAHLLTCFGNMPAIAKMMCMKGVNGKHPCRACKITGICAAGSNKNYVPLSRPYAAHDEGPRSYNPLNLPRRTHVEFLREALHVKKSKTNAQEERRSQRTGINGLSSLVQLGSLDFPGSFPHDFMHVMFENLIPTLISLWTCSDKYSTFGSEDDNYILDKTVWSALCNACAQTGNTIPARFGCRVPNFATNRGEATSESTLLFATLLAPALLRRQFSDSATIATLLNSSHLSGSVARS
ncbi:Transposase family tnp2 [Ceratobasidium sp. AG-Ba]|nr:Transposase family tnp2 [Ceratobasidium sp. AG-Ba]